MSHAMPKVTLPSGETRICSKESPGLVSRSGERVLRLIIDDIPALEDIHPGDRVTWHDGSGTHVFEVLHAEPREPANDGYALLVALTVRPDGSVPNPRYREDSQGLEDG